MRVHPLLEELTDGCERATAVIRQRTREAAGGVLGRLLPNRASDIGEIPSSVLDD